MAAAHPAHPSSPGNSSHPHFICYLFFNCRQAVRFYSAVLYRKTFGAVKPSNAKIVASNVKTAVLTGTKMGRTELPVFEDGGTGQAFHISEFLNHPSGVEALLNTRALHSFQFVDVNLYRCTLPRIKLLNFEASPILDLRIIPTKQDCRVELISCQFEGSEVLERQNEHFSATMVNHIKWDTDCSEPFLEVEVKVNVNLEIHTQPFTSLPNSAVQGPGNLMIQALVDALVPVFLQQLMEDYRQWVHDLRAGRI